MYEKNRHEFIRTERGTDITDIIVKTYHHIYNIDEEEATQCLQHVRLDCRL